MPKKPHYSGLLVPTANLNTSSRIRYYVFLNYTVHTLYWYIISIIQFNWLDSIKGFRCWQIFWLPARDPLFSSAPCTLSALALQGGTTRNPAYGDCSVFLGMGVIRKKTITKGTEGGLKYICDVCFGDITSTVSGIPQNQSVLPRKSINYRLHRSHTNYIRIISGSY